MRSNIAYESDLLHWFFFHISIYSVCHGLHYKYRFFFSSKNDIKRFLDCLFNFYTYDYGDKKLTSLNLRTTEHMCKTANVHC